MIVSTSANLLQTTGASQIDDFDFEYNIRVIKETLELKTLPKRAAKNLNYLMGNLEITQVYEDWLDAEMIKPLGQILGNTPRQTSGDRDGT